MEKTQFYQEAYNSFKESYEIARNANFLSFPELNVLTNKVVEVYTSLVPQEVRDTFEIKVSDLEEFLKAREFAEKLLTFIII